VASDEASLLSAQQTLATAQQSLAGATLSSPITGKVGALSLVKGQASGSKSVTIIGTGAATVTVQVPLTVRPLVQSGEKATVAVPGSTSTLTGTVTQVNPLTSSTSSSSNPTYPATITLDDPQNLLYAGGIASAVVSLGDVSDVTVLPGSAVTPTGVGTGTVQVQAASSGTPSTVQVVTGATGQGLVQIVSGLNPGQTVVLADLNAAVPANSNQRQAPGGSSTSTRAVQPSAAPSR
jgi:multidrug efflux pump subunit AcrA (membrane-fusion protein)